MRESDRRKFLRHGVATFAAMQLPALAISPLSAAASGDPVLVHALRAFLDYGLVTHAMQCGARLGDGVPPVQDVEAFLAMARTLARQDPHRLIEHLKASTLNDLAGDDILVVDGWVFARTEAVAASAYILVTGEDCRLDAAALQ